MTALANPMVETGGLHVHFRSDAPPPGLYVTRPDQARCPTGMIGTDGAGETVASVLEDFQAATRPPKPGFSGHCRNCTLAALQGLPDRDAAERPPSAGSGEGANLLVALGRAHP